MTQICYYCLIIDSECATLKNEYVMGEYRMSLTTLNPNYIHVTIEGTDLENCVFSAYPFAYKRVLLIG